ncbi:MAG TPA: ATP synthase F0 subunit B [Candidatus Angelobacter sp.]|jgi:F-type H+-transporting ATPase subunit b|nr:ATP synthase F0 subunit B [Candidatus Angelobacter sp.]
MNETLTQLGELLLASIPTIIFLLIVWGAYRMIVHKRLEQVLAERYQLTEGAIQQAQAEIKSAEARTAEYELRVREARTQIYKIQEARRQQIMESRNAALTQARQQAEEMIQSARMALEQDKMAAQLGLQQQADTLANQIIESILKPVAAMGGR